MSINKEQLQKILSLEDENVRKRKKFLFFKSNAPSKIHISLSTEDIEIQCIFENLTEEKAKEWITKTLKNCTLKNNDYTISTSKKKICESECIILSAKISL